MSAELSHIDEQGQARMVDVGAKPDTERVAVARGSVQMAAETLQLIMAGQMKKGEVLVVAQLAGIMAAKRTSELIPLCHPLPLTHIEVTCTPDPNANCINIEASARVRGKTGVEMEALTAVAVAALTIYDMAKAVDRAMQITDIHLAYKAGGKSGVYEYEKEEGRMS
ncbi:MAG: cyclic pyranopterin monophosphate synthase MoaC [Candidatus Promineifilaceae bacterium]